MRDKTFKLAKEFLQGPNNADVASNDNLTLKVQKLKIVKFANSVDPFEETHNELPLLDIHCLPKSP